MKGKLLIETVTNDMAEFKGLFEHKITESEGKKQIKIFGPMIVCETKNKNGRVYKKSLIEKEVNRFNGLCQQNHLSTRVGCDHPATAELPLKDTAGRLLKLTESMSNPNIYCGEVEVFPHSPHGGLIMDMIGAGMFPGFSSRALGNVNEGIVEDVNLISVDFVSDPSAEVYVEKMYENKIYENRNGILIECVGESKKPSVDTQKMVLEIFGKEFEDMDANYLVEEFKPNAKLVKFYNDMVLLNGKESTVKLFNNIIEGKINIFNNKLLECGYDLSKNTDKNKMKIFVKTYINK